MKTNTQDRRTAAPPAPAQRAGFEINEWCGLAGFGRAFLYRMLADGRGPQAVKIGRRTLITEPPADFLARAGRPYRADGEAQ